MSGRIEHNALVLERARSQPARITCMCIVPPPASTLLRASRCSQRTASPCSRAGLIPFNAALVGFVEATRHDIAEKNRLCPPNRLPNVPLDWVRGMLIGTNADHLWSKEPDITAWLERARLNPSRGLRQRGDEPQVRQARKRYADNVRPAIAKLTQFLADARA